ncbi:MAG TPA: FAD/NAD(P)-binding oxidoreductase [Microbacteriaceae bacterium]|nr:FAD/NAD(P)-binding oxidoreductase [Microbacteriaceae bacterium]
MKCNVLIIGGGTGGIAVAARLRNKNVDDIVILEPAKTHYYQPIWTLVGGGLAPVEQSAKPMSKLIPKGVKWVQQAAVSVDAQTQTVKTADGTEIEYNRLVVAAGIQLDWDATPGMWEAVNSDHGSSNYLYDLAPHTWDLIKNMKSGTAVFMQPSGPIKCAGAPQKIAYLAADYWRKQGVLDDIRMVMILPTPGMFGVPVFKKELEKVVAGYGIEVKFNSEVTNFDVAKRELTISNLGEGDTPDEKLQYDFVHALPRQSAPDWIKDSALSVPDSPQGYVDVDKNTLQHVRYPNIFAIGDCGSTPNSKTGAAIRQQAPTVVQNIIDSLEGRELSASYGGYASCPLPVARDKILIAEFDYTLEATPTLPLINTLKPVKDFGLFKRRMLPMMYWKFMMKGRA